MKDSKNTSLNIPKIIHFIWAGGSELLSEKNMQTIAKWALNNSEFQIYIWIDEKTSKFSLAKLNSSYHESFARAYNTVCEQGGKSPSEIPSILKILDIRQENICSNNEEEIIYYEMDRIDPNYGASSDVIRYRVLYKIGGVYADSDVDCGKTPLSSIPEFKHCSIHTVYLDHLSQVKNDDLNPKLLESFPTHRAQIGNDAFICTAENPLIKKLIDHVEKENYQLAQLYNEHKSSLILESILEAAYGSHNMKDITIGRSGPSAGRHVLENKASGILRIRQEGSVTECAKIIDGVLVAVKPLKCKQYQIVEPVIEIKPITSFKTPNRSSWLNVGIDIDRFNTLEAIYENLVKTIAFEQAHFGILRLSDHFRLLKKISIAIGEKPSTAYSQFLDKLQGAKIIEKNRIICIQMSNLDSKIFDFYKQHQLLEKTHLRDPKYCKMILQWNTSEKFFCSNLFTDEKLKKFGNKIWCSAISESLVQNEIENIFGKLDIGAHFIELILSQQGIYSKTYPLENLGNILDRYQLILAKATPLVEQFGFELVNTQELMNRFVNLKTRIVEILQYKDIATEINKEGKHLFINQNFEGSLSVFQNGLVRIRDVLGIDSEEVSTLNYNIASCYIRLEHFDEAAPYLRQCVASRTRIFGENDPQTKNSEKKLDDLQAKIDKISLKNNK
jgi:hypothetical protein